MIVFSLFFSLFLYSEASTKNSSACLKDSDCSNINSCKQGICDNPCSLGFCETDALCIVIRHKPHCFCINSKDDCLTKEVQSNTCDPECKKNSSCNKRIGYCECNDGFQGNPYKTCVKKCETNHDCPFGEACIRKNCKNTCNICGVDAKCTSSNHSSICTCPVGFSGDPYEICTPSSKVVLDMGLCEKCGENAECNLNENGSRVCACPSGFIGNPYKSCVKICLKNTDCPADEICSHNTCKNPCEDSCGVNALCTLEKNVKTPKCECMKGFTGDPTRICTALILESRFRNLQCNPKCGENATCDTLYGVCHCNEGFIGNPYGTCRKKCYSNLNCHRNEACLKGDCINPCVDSCGKNSLCSVENHDAVCKCPRGYSGNPLDFCRKVTEKPTTFDEVDLCNFTTCAHKAKCKNGACECLTGYTGNPYRNCSKKCDKSNDCSNVEFCKNGICVNSCKESCGINANCNVIMHTPICSCPKNYQGDSSRICIPNTRSVLFNPGRAPCLKCICSALTGGNDNIIECANKTISFGYWEFAGENIVGGETFRTKNTTLDFITCMNDEICILNTMNEYVTRVLRRLNDIDCDGKLTCADYFAAHKFGMMAKFSDSIFNKTEGRIFDKCEGHGDKTVTNNWIPKNCIGPNYTEILS